ncbi:MAG: FAD-binding oxidoreductase [Phycisphaerae bacterium]|nr:FAD-binding oxidoreductase [Phycisphaerae bacterium]
MLDILRRHFGDQATEPSDGKPVTAVVRPRDIEEACGVVRLAREHGHQVIPVGGRTKLHWTGAARGPAIEMDMRDLSRVVEYSPEDMTITVEAGLGLAKLSELLAENRQRLTLDSPGADRATIGGVLAANDSGPIRLAYGTARDIVIGMSMIGSDGEVFKSGGKVVKNVAGYDLHKLFIGSFGAMGPIATVSFKLRPLPEARGLVVLTPRDASEAESMIAAALAGETRPTLIELLNGRMASTIGLLARTTLIIGFEENAEAVAWQCATLAKALGGVPLTATDSGRIYQSLCRAAGAEAATSFKATMLSSEVAEFVERADRLPMKLIARAGNGVVYGLPEEPMTEAAWQELEAVTERVEGTLHVRGNLPAPGWKRFGRPRGDAFLTAAIQQAFDPEAMFAPERLA